MAGERFALSTDGITYTEAPIEPRVEFEYGSDYAIRGDGHKIVLGGAKLRWYFAEQFVTGEEFFWFVNWVTGLSQDIYVISKIPEAYLADGSPEYKEMQGIMGRPTGKIYSEEGEGQTFTDVSIDFWNLVEVP